MPFGPYILCPLIAIMSAERGRSARPSPCTASHRNSAPTSWANLASVSTGWITPISLLTSITASSAARSSSSAATRAGSSSPSRPTGSSTASNPSSPSASTVSRTAECSVSTASTRMRRGSARRAFRAVPCIAMLSASVAPEVKRRRPPSGIVAATRSRATSTAAAAVRPGRCALWGLAKRSRSQGVIASKTSGASGVVA